MIKAVGLVAAVVVAEATFVARVAEVDSEGLRRIARVGCAECGTDHGRVDMWDPDAIEPEHIPDRWRGQVDVRGGVELAAHLIKERLNYTFMHEDFEAVVMNERNRLQKRKRSPASSVDDEWFQEYHTYDEMEQQLTFMAANYSSDLKAEKIVIGRTYAGKEIHGIRMGNTAGHTADMKAVWIQCGIHAREWIAPITCMYFTQKLMQDSKTDPTLSGMFRDVTVFMIPSLNRDGYEFTWSDNRMWRKNRQPNAGSTAVGTDLNRNWDADWGKCGASTNPSSDTYRGSGPFSGTEAKVVHDYIGQLKSDGYHLLAGHDFHSYGNLLLRPYGWTGADTPNDAVEKRRGQAIVEAIARSSGQIYTNQKAFELYCCSGLAVDWIAEQTMENSGFTFELRGDPGGFVLPPTQIISSGEEIYAAMRVWFQEVLYAPVN